MFKKLFGKKKGQQEAAEDGVTMNDSAYDPSVTQPGIGAFLHGRLIVRVIAARDVEGKGGRFFNKLERIVTSSVDGVDPYCSVKLGYNKIMQTPTVDNTSSPEWNSIAVMEVCHDFAKLEFRIKAAKRSGPLSIISKVKHLSMLSITAAEIKDKRVISGWFPMSHYQKEVVAEGEGGDSGSESEEEEEADDGDYGEINIHIEYTPVEHIQELQSVSTPNTYFPVRQGVRVTFYQDADTPPGSLPEIPFRPEFEHSRCWIDLAKAIMNSTQLIYITGWAVWPELIMVRTDYPGDEWNGLTLGEMLKQKAEEGVNVCVMVWDEYASGMFGSKGLMGTHDEEVIHYFKKTKVNAIKVGRQNAKEGPLSDLNDSVLFTHHQKTVVVTRFDSETEQHRLEAWIGGLDLTEGRYDNNEHSLFRTLDTVHAPPDFWQACALGTAAESGPREPWHDIHSHVTGAAAWDILENFEDRWKMQAADSMREALYPHDSGAILPASGEEEIGDGTFNVQILRSINESSAQIQDGREGLIVRARAKTDQSIHTSYIHNIRRAKHFIYIENQYFLGSSHMWHSGQRGGFAPHLVAIEIAEKICAKIRANERFAVYVNVPIHPEGAPDSGAVQEILSHQRKTVQLITSRITKTIAETGSETKISDWFNMFCLVNRESQDGGKGNGGSTEMEQKLSEQRRFMIYLHSKFAIFDDTVAIVGSANINSRSMDGSRDTEIAIMAWEPEHVATGPDAYSEITEDSYLPKGDVAAFRASVWSEHLGGFMDEFENPSSINCINVVRELAEHNWGHFAADGAEFAEDMPHGHLALYPYSFDESTGEATPVQEYYPDFDAALIKGKATPGIPNMLTG